MNASASERRALDTLAEFNAALPEPMRVRLQTVFARSLFLSKKRYIGIDGEGQIHYAGTLNRRSDAPALLRERFEEIAALLLHEGGASLAEISASLQRAHERIREAAPCSLAALMKIGSNISRDPGDGSRTPLHVALARCENARNLGMDYRAGDSVEFVACTDLDRRGKMTRVFRAPSEALATKVDRLHYWAVFESAALEAVAVALGDDVAESARNSVRPF
jgi:DNA polymerase elongation subunit (family B)